MDRSWEYIDRSYTHECGNWGLRPRNSFSGNIYIQIYLQCTPIELDNETLEIFLMWQGFTFTLLKGVAFSLGLYSETWFHIGMDRNFVCLWRRHNCRSQVIDLSLSALISWFMKSNTRFLNNSNFTCNNFKKIYFALLEEFITMLISRFNLLQSFKYTPFLFYKKRFKSEIISFWLCTLSWNF